MKPGYFFVSATLLAFLPLFANVQADVQAAKKHFLTVKSTFYLEGILLEIKIGDV